MIQILAARQVCFPPTAESTSKIGVDKNVDTNDEVLWTWGLKEMAREKGQDVDEPSLSALEMGGLNESSDARDEPREDLPGHWLIWWLRKAQRFQLMSQQLNAELHNHTDRTDQDGSSTQSTN
jgi:hypothetical protein